QLDPLGAGLPAQGLVELGIQDLPVLGALGRRLEARIFQERLRAQRLAEPAEHVLPGRRDVDVPVRRREDAVGIPVGWSLPAWGGMAPSISQRAAWKSSIVTMASSSEV